MRLGNSARAQGPTLIHVYKSDELGQATRSRISVASVGRYGSFGAQTLFTILREVHAFDRVEMPAAGRAADG